jgi:hypothetical protein
MITRAMLRFSIGAIVTTFVIDTLVLLPSLLDEGWVALERFFLHWRLGACCAILGGVAALWLTWDTNENRR